MSSNILEIVDAADALLNKHHTRDPFKLADILDIEILYLGAVSTVGITEDIT